MVYQFKLIKTNPKAARYLVKDGYMSFKTLDSIFAHSTTLGSLAFGTASLHAPVAEHFSKDEDHTDTLTQEEHHIDNVVNDIRSRLNRLRASSSNGARGICGS